MSLKDKFSDSGLKKAKVRASVLTSKKPAGTAAAKKPEPAAPVPTRSAAAPVAAPAASSTTQVSVYLPHVFHVTGILYDC